MNKKIIKTKILVLGGGPGGYTAAFRCSDLGFDVILVEKNEFLGGVCLNYGCIPSKSLLHLSKTINNIKKFNNYGITNLKTDLLNIKNLNSWKNRIISQLSKGLLKLSKLRNINIINGFGIFVKKNLLKINDSNIFIEFEFSIIATGSSPTKLNICDINNIWYSSDALELKFIPKKLLIIGGGIIGVEMATIYESLGSKVDIIESNSKILSDFDEDLINVFCNSIKNKYNIFENVSINKIKKLDNDLIEVTTKNNINNEINTKKYNAILVSIGRKPNTNNIGLENININLDNKNFILVDSNMKSNVENIYAIGDVIGNPMLAHKAIHEAKIASESIFYKNKNKNIISIIPSIIYSDPEIACVGINEKTAIKNNINYEISKFNWNALGKSIINDSDYGFTKLIFDKESKKIIGGSAIGYNCSEILGEISLAIEMCCTYEDISLIIHSHPTIYESIGLSSSILNRSITEILNNKILK